MRSVQRTLSFQSRNRGPSGILCTRGEKAHTSKRVSIIACNNVISKAQCAPCGCDIAFAVICLRRDICPLGKLRIYLNFG